MLEASDFAGHARYEAAFDYMTQGATSATTKRAKPEVPAFIADVYRANGNFSREIFLSCIGDRDGVFNWNVADRLHNVHQPALVIAGQEDQTMPMDAVRALAAGIPNATFELVPDVGHYYPLERPMDFNEDLRASLAKVEW